MDSETAAAYLARLEVPGDTKADADGLRRLHQAHQVAVPFENLSIHLSEGISLSEEELVAKVVTRRRGGLCYELNGLFAALLESLGATVTLVGGRVYGENGFGPPFDHLALIVRGIDDSGPWLADVGFGSHSTYPLLLDSRSGQEDPGGVFVLSDTADGDLEVTKNGRPQYRLELRPRVLEDFLPTCWYQQTSPSSHFTQGTICSRLTDDGRVSIAGRLLIRTSDGNRTEEQLADDAALLAAYDEYFGVVLSAAPLIPGE